MYSATIFTSVHIEILLLSLHVFYQPPEEDRGVQGPKRYDKYGDKDEGNSPKNVNNVHKASSQKL